MDLKELLSHTREIRQNLPNLSKEELIDVVQDLLSIIQELDIMYNRIIRELGEEE